MLRRVKEAEAESLNLLEAVQAEEVVAAYMVCQLPPPHVCNQTCNLRNGPGEKALDGVKAGLVALDHGMSRLKKLPLCVRLTRELHEKLMMGVQGHQARTFSEDSELDWQAWQHDRNCFLHPTPSRRGRAVCCGLGKVSVSIDPSAFGNHSSGPLSIRSPSPVP